MINLENYINRANYYRGKIINQFAFLEMTMSVIITESFTTDKNSGNQMYHTLLERMTFENKRASFQSIVYNQAEGNRKKHGEIFKELSALNDLRNQFAHYPMIPIVDEKDEITGIALAKFRHKPNAIHFTLDELESIIKRIEHLDFKLDQIFKKDKFQSSAGTT
ncbi:MAG: hypothetical protein JWM28_3130 [Chitinophagaceae bacterium]|nr:hypothetical protein [Chitinophagaceae bacterium]